MFLLKHLMSAFRAKRKRVNTQRALDKIAKSSLFSSDWYLQANPDVAADAYWSEHAAEHYVSFGASEGRDPSPRFSSTAYAWLHNLPDNTNPLLHALEHNAERQAKFTTFDTLLPPTAGRPWLMVCAHSGGPDIFGAERSLLDVLDGLNAAGFNILLTLPAIRNKAYWQLLQHKVHQIAVLPYFWWRHARPAQVETVQLFSQLIQQFSVTHCYCNTLVLYEPLIAAKQAGIKRIVHVRELPDADTDLCLRMAATAQQVKQHLRYTAEYCIANSVCVAHYVDMPGRCYVIPNVIDVDMFSAVAAVNYAPDSILRVGLISSNLPKKGLADFVALAGLLKPYADRIRLCLIGPDNEHIVKLKGMQHSGELSDIVEFVGYADSPVQAISSLHIVLNLSHFKESFGRTVLEAMAAGRVVICYDWGALPELVSDKLLGFCVPFADVEAVAAAILHLLNSPDRLNKMAGAARVSALQNFDKAQLPQVLKTVFNSIE